MFHNRLYQVPAGDLPLEDGYPLLFNFKDSKEFLSDKQLDQFCHMWNAGLERMQSHP